MGASQADQINWLARIVRLANPACSKANCHGRGVACSSWSENQSPLGSGEYWPESFYEEDVCECVKEGLLQRAIDELVEFIEQTWEQPSLLDAYQMAHWGCKQCEIDTLNTECAERELDGDRLQGEIVGLKNDLQNVRELREEDEKKIKGLQGQLDNALGEIDEHETAVINADMNRRHQT